MMSDQELRELRDEVRSGGVSPLMARQLLLELIAALELERAQCRAVTLGRDKQLERVGQLEREVLELRTYIGARQAFDRARELTGPWPRSGSSGAELIAAARHVQRELEREHAGLPTAAFVVEQVKDFMAIDQRREEFERAKERAARVVELTPFADGTHTGTRQLDVKRRAAAAIRALEFEP